MDKGIIVPPLRRKAFENKLIVRFGTDFSLLQEYFPRKNRKQIKKKYRYIYEHKQHTLDRLERNFER